MYSPKSCKLSYLCASAAAAAAQPLPHCRQHRLRLLITCSSGDFHNLHICPAFHSLHLRVGSMVKREEHGKGEGQEWAGGKLPLLLGAAATAAVCAHNPNASASFPPTCGVVCPWRATGTVPRTSGAASRRDCTAGKKRSLHSSILPTCSMVGVVGLGRGSPVHRISPTIYEVESG